MKKFVAVICTIVVLALIPFSIFVIEQTKAKKENDNHTDIDIVSAAKSSANSYNISQKSEQIEVELESILATKEFIFVWISANGIPGNALYDYLDELIPQNEPIVIDLYLNDDQTFERNLALIET